MRNLISIAFLFLGGCYTINIDFVTPVTPTADAGPMLGGDGGPVMVEPDAGADAFVAPMPDAGSDAGADSPMLSVSADNLRRSTILVAGGDVWQNVAQYRIHASVDSTLQCVRVQIDGDAADVDEVAIAMDGSIHGLGILPSGTDTSTTICLSIPIAMPADAETFIQVWVKIPNVVSFASTSGADIGACNSGDRFRMGIDYVDFLATGAVPATFPTIWGNEFQIRRTRPTVTRQALSSSTLTNGIEQDLYRLQISADSSGSVALHQVQYTLVAPAGSAFTLSYFGLRKGSTEDLDIVIVDEDGNNLRGGSLTFAGGDSHRVTVIFLHEDTVSGSGNVYTLHAMPSDVGAGDTLNVTLHRTEDGSTGYLMDSYFAIDASPLGAGGTTPPRAAGFIWSDLSEVPHSDNYGCTGCGGSRDWMDGSLLDDFSAVTTISR